MNFNQMKCIVLLQVIRYQEYYQDCASDPQYIAFHSNKTSSKLCHNHLANILDRFSKITGPNGVSQSDG